ncbi:MAG: LPS-assembly protein LptD, partial [Barnesiella sp.]|nr:LPS-assembly protein LptD [Barnesiella sp.]
PQPQPNTLPPDPNEEPEDDTASEESDTQFGADGYAIWEVPWSLSINYSVNYGYGSFNKKKMEYNGRFTQNLSFSGNINFTKNWSFNFSASYDFDAKKIAYMNCNITRDLHCWSMSASFVPVGPYKSYNFHISVKSSLLQDLKYDKRGNSYSRLDWY